MSIPNTFEDFLNEGTFDMDRGVWKVNEGKKYDWFDDLPPSLHNLPKNPTGKNLTKKQINDWIDYLSKKPLKELRKRQDLIRGQIKIAFDTKNDTALETLGFIENLLTSAVDKKEFGD